MNRFFAKEYTIVRGGENWERYPSYIKWCKDYIGVRGNGWQWEKGWTKPYETQTHIFYPIQKITFIFEDPKHYAEFVLTHMV